MKLRNTLVALLCLASISAFAIPARRGATYQAVQPDGSVVTLELVGDEHAHFYLTTDKKIVLADGDKYCYASVDAYDNLVNTGVLAHDVADRAADEIALVDGISTDRVKAVFATRRMDAARANSQDGKGSFSQAFPTTGSVKSLVFLVEYSDVHFSIDDPYGYFNGLCNQVGFSENGAKGSVHDYYYDSSMGKFDIHFDVYGPVQLPNSRAYYGANTNGPGTDVRPREMMLHAAQALDATVDFSQYDLDGDGFVDNVYIFYAGNGESEPGVSTDCVWPHQSSIGKNSRYRFDNVYFSRYACGGELAGNKPDAIGTFCHEFGHVLGLPDLYNTDDMTVSYTPLSYSLMDQGCYNDGGTLPPVLSAFERNALKWMGDDLVEITGPATCSLENLADSNKAFLINTDNPNEFFLFENRQQTGWDARIPGHGMLVWHIDFNQSIFKNNKTNNDPNHQRVDIVEAGNKAKDSKIIMRQYPFPGTANVTSFTFNTAPSFRSWSGADLGLPITNITEKNGIITFDVAGGGSDPASVADIVANPNMSYSVNGGCISVASEGAISIVDLSGRVLANGIDQLEISGVAPGLYIITTANGSAKIMVK